MTLDHRPPAPDTLPSYRPVVLAVSEAAGTLDALHGTLSAGGYVVLDAPGAEEALRHCGRIVPDIMLIDAGLPDGEGYALCRRIKSMPSWRHVPVVFMTDLADTAQIGRAYANGANDTLSKPLRLPEVVARLITQIDCAERQAVPA